jgi:hypothetical protein
MKSHYNNLNEKLHSLQAKQRRKTKTRHNNQEQQFYPRTVNLTKIKFTKAEMALLNQGLQHSIGRPLKTFWTNLIVEAERAIKLLDTKLQNPYRIADARKMKQIFHSDNHHNTIQKRQIYIYIL